MKKNKIEMKEYGTKLFEQENGSIVALRILEIFEATNEVVLLDFNDVDAANTAFFNALVSGLIKKDKKIKDLPHIFNISNAKESIISVFALTMQYVKFFKYEK